MPLLLVLLFIIVPIAELAVLIQVGLKLCSPALFRTQWKLGMHQFLPFAVAVN